MRYVVHMPWRINRQAPRRCDVVWMRLLALAVSQRSFTLGLLNTRVCS